MRSKRLSDQVDRLTACRAFRGAAWPTAGGTQKIPYDSVSYDKGGNFIMSQARYMCPVDGLYDFRMGFMTGQTNPQLQSMMYKNGAYISGGMINAASAAGVGVVHSDIQDCKAGDYLEGWIWVGVAAISMPADPNGSGCWMTIVRLAERNL